MDTIELPVVSEDASVWSTVRAMQSANRHAVIVSRNDGSAELYMNHEIRAAIEAQIEHVRDLPRSSRVAALAVERASAGDAAVMVEGAAAPGQSPGSPPFHPVDLESELDTHNARFGFVQPAMRGMLQVITRHEGIAAEVRNADKVCACDEPGHHPADSPPKTTGDPCDSCSGTYECF